MFSALPQFLYYAQAGCKRHLQIKLRASDLPDIVPTHPPQSLFSTACYHSSQTTSEDHPACVEGQRYLPPML